MMDIHELYQDLIVDHGMNPRNSGKLPQPNCCAKGYNPLCGDELELFLIVKDDTIIDVKFEATGCAISVASASLMSEAIKGKSLTEAQKLFKGFHNLITDSETQDPDKLGKLSILSGVKAYPARVKCATLAWHTLNNALNDPNSDQAATTE